MTRLEGWGAILILHLVGCDGTAPRRAADLDSGAVDASMDSGSADVPDAGAVDASMDSGSTDVPDAGPDARPDTGASRVRPENPIVRENALPGTSEWTLRKPATAHEVEGYSSATSVSPGDTVTLFVSVSEEHAVHWEMYRLGYYSGLGARFIASGPPRVISRQPDCPVSPDTGLVECAWAPGATVSLDTGLVSGYYLFKLIRDDGFESYVPLVVRELSPRAPLLVQSSVTTWQAYNEWGGSSLYANSLPESVGFTARHAYQVSFDRPYDPPDGSGRLFEYESFMLQWLEMKGYDLAYVTNIDVDENPALVLGRKLFLDVGHDEYWSLPERDAVEKARDQQVSLGFFSANSAYWRIRLEPSSAGTPRRIVTCYKDAKLDPVRRSPDTTVKYRDKPSAQPENALIGQMYELFGDLDFPVVVTNPTHWAYEGTGVKLGDTISHVVGDEWDHVWDNGATPEGLEVVARSPAFGVYGSETTSDVTVYYPSPSTFVFAVGTREWTWGLGKPGYEDSRIKRMTENVIARAGLPPAEPTKVEPMPPPDDIGGSSRVTLVAGSGAAGFADGNGAEAQFDAPAGVAVDSSGTIYVTDTRNQRIRKITSDGTVSTLAGCGPTGVTTNFSMSNGTGEEACFGVPTGIAVGPDGQLYVSDSHNNRIRVMTTDGVVKTFAGDGSVGSEDATNPLAASFAYPRGLAFGPDGALYVADARNHAIRRIGPDGVTTVAQDSSEVTAVAVGPDGVVYVLASTGRVSLVHGGMLVPLVDVDGVPGDQPGPGASARLRPADGLVVDGDALLVSDSGNYKVRRIALSADHTVTTLVGDGRAGDALGTGATTHVMSPRGLAVTASGYLIADSGNNRILQVLR